MAVLLRYHYLVAAAGAAVVCVRLGGRIDYETLAWPAAHWLGADCVCMPVALSNTVWHIYHSVCQLGWLSVPGIVEVELPF